MNKICFLRITIIQHNQGCCNVPGNLWLGHRPAMVGGIVGVPKAEAEAEAEEAEEEDDDEEATIVGLLLDGAVLSASCVA
ncbi:hypothetical protein T4E_11981 [Trichinella pseudospiralis]|uniref:Uncharacterized protein n=1 Tax=Trichinella pseudospiralis TaxID=6337 RepID=A0A0V0XY16_TRIPS|nr:hypothetical protein T4E_11981 [Trichinella pseudospiralis]